MVDNNDWPWVLYKLNIKVEGGDNWAKLSQKWHPSPLFSLLLTETEKAQYITPQTLE